MSNTTAAYIALIGAGASAALLVLEVIPGGHNALNAKRGIAMGEGVGYFLAYPIVK